MQLSLQVLSTGAVVVDLPGVRDANAARGAVAEKYMKSCNAVWIVADITRAVDNRTAKVHKICGERCNCLQLPCVFTPCQHAVPPAVKSFLSSAAFAWQNKACLLSAGLAR